MLSTPPLSGLNASVVDKSLDRVSWAIIIHTTKSMLDGTLLGHFRQPITTCPVPPAERKDKDDGKSSLPQSLTVACRIMMALPPSQHHHDKPKSLPTIKGDKAPGTIKDPHTVKEGKHFFLKRRTQVRISKCQSKKLTKPSESVSGPPVRTSFAGQMKEVSSSVEKVRPSDICSGPGNARPQHLPIKKNIRIFLLQYFFLVQMKLC